MELKTTLKQSGFIVAGLCSVCLVQAQPRPAVPEKYQQCFVKFSGERSPLDAALNRIGLPGSVVGRSIALLVGVSRYPNMMARSDRELKPAAADLRQISDYLNSQEFFDEIIVVKDEQVTLETFQFFLQDYIRRRLEGSAKSRFLFVYTGHGFNDNTRSYLLLSSATNLRDKGNSINLEVLKPLVDEVIEASFHSLVLVNACNSGPFRRTPYGSQGTLVPLYRGAHAIAAAGTQEASWSDPRVGSGSVFFEKFLSAVRGAADYPRPGDAQGDGIITVDELYTFLRREVEAATNQQQNPLMTDLLPNGSKGGFFFLNRQHPVQSPYFPSVRRLNGDRFGSEPNAEGTTSVPIPTSIPPAMTKESEKAPVRADLPRTEIAEGKSKASTSFDVRHVHNHIFWMTPGDGVLYISSEKLEFKEADNPSHDFSVPCRVPVRSKYLNWAGPVAFATNMGFKIVANGKPYNFTGVGTTVGEIKDEIEKLCSVTGTKQTAQPSR